MTDSNEKSTVTIRDRKVLTMGGVKDIRGFDEEGIALETELGRVHIEGKELKIESLSREGGNILIRGEIESVFFTDAPEKRKGLFSR